MLSKLVLLADEKIANKIVGYTKKENCFFTVASTCISYDDCIQRSAELETDLVLIQLKHPVYKIHNFFHDLIQLKKSPILLIFHVVAEGQIVYSITSHKDHNFVSALKRFFVNALKEYQCSFNYIGEEKEKDSNLVMGARINKLEKNEYLNDILRGVTDSEFAYYKKKTNLNLNDSGYYMYIWDFMEIEFSDHDRNKNIYYFVGEEFVKECQSVLEAYDGGEVFYVNPMLLCIIINDFHTLSYASKQQKLSALVSELNSITNSKAAFRYMSSFIKNAESIRAAYEKFHYIKTYSFFCKESRLLTQAYVDSLKKDADICLMHETIKEIKEYINFDIFNEKLTSLIERLFLSIVKPSMNLNLYYYCHASISSSLMDKYNILYNKRLPDNPPPTSLIFTSIEQSCGELIRSISKLKAELSNRYVVQSAIVLQAIEYIQHHYSEDITVNHIASHLNISNSYLSQIFKKELGTSMIGYLISFRIQKAEDLLSGGEAPIYQIASKVGFSEVKHFSKTFKKLTGFTPMQYKKQNAKSQYI